jgi:hypothetical protein
MTTANNKNGKSVLAQIARRVMLEHGFQTDFSTAALDELAKIQNGDTGKDTAFKDLRQLLWASIDNEKKSSLQFLFCRIYKIMVILDELLKMISSLFLRSE